MNAAEAIARIRSKHHIPDATEVGVRGVWPKQRPAVNATAREISIICNTDDVDSDNEVVVPGGLDFGPMKRNDGRLFLDHWYDTDHTIGSVRRMKPYGGKDAPAAWIMDAYIRRGGTGDDILTATREVGIGASIGFVPLEYGPPQADDPPHYQQARRVIRKAEVYEVSLTMLPANVACQALTVGDEEEEPAHLALIGGLVTKGRIREDSARLLGWALEAAAKADAQAERKRLVFAPAKRLVF